MDNDITTTPTWQNPDNGVESTPTTPSPPSQSSFSPTEISTTFIGISPNSDDFSSTTTSTLSLPPPSSLSSSTISPSSSSLPSLFPGIHAADLFLEDYNESDDYNDIIDNNIIEHSSSSSILPNADQLLNISFPPCISFSSTLSSINDRNNTDSVLCDGSLTKTKLFSSDDLWTENEIFARKLIPAMTFIAFLMLIGMVGNTLVVYVYGLRFKPATQHFLIVCMACFDLVMCCVAMPAEIADMRFHHTFTSVFACKLLRFVTMFASISSSFTLVTVAYDRHRRITRPLSKQMSMKEARIWTICNMVASLCVSWPTLVLTGIRTSETRIPGLVGTDCSFSEKFKKTKFPLAYNAVLGFGFFTLVTVIAVFYFRIWKTAKTRKINMAKRYTIGSLSDQFMTDLKLQKKLSREKMDELLSQQLEKCARDKLRTKASIDCKDLYYFFETNSVRKTVCSGINRKRGRYKEVSISASDNSESGSPRNSDSDDYVIGQSFSYRKSVNSSRIDEHTLNEISRIRFLTGRKSRKLNESFAMSKIPEHSTTKNERLEVHANPKNKNNVGDANSLLPDKVTRSDSSKSYLRTEKQSDGVSGDQNSQAVLIKSNSKDKEQNEITCLPNGINRSVEIGENSRRDPEALCFGSNSKNPFDTFGKMVTSPSISVKSSISGQSASPSPGRYRRNSSPLIRPKGKRVKDNVKSSISIISDDYRPRPMSSLVDSVSQSLARFQEFSNFDIVDGINKNTNNGRPSLKLHRGFVVNENDDNANDDDIVMLEKAVNDEGGCEIRILKCDFKNNENSGETNYENSDDEVAGNDSILFDVNKNPTLSAENVTNGMKDPQTKFNDRLDCFINRNDSFGPDRTLCENNGVDELAGCTSPEIFESFSHLIGPRSQPMEIPIRLQDEVSTDSETDTKYHSSNSHKYDDTHDGSSCQLRNEPSFKINESSTSSFGVEKGYEGQTPASTRVDTDSSRFGKGSSDAESPKSAGGKNLITSLTSNRPHTSDSPMTTDIENCKSKIDFEDASSNTSPKSSKTMPAQRSSITVIGSDSSSTNNPSSSSESNSDSCEVDTIFRNKPRSASTPSLDTNTNSSTTADVTIRRRGGSGGGGGGGKTGSIWIYLSQNLDKTTIVAFAVSFVFILSFLPFLILMFIRGLVKDFDYSLEGATLCTYHIFLRFYFLNSAINPFLYGLLNINFRYECAHTWRKLFRCLDRKETDGRKNKMMC